MPNHLTRSEVCKLLGISEKSLYLWEKDGRVPQPKRDRRNWRVYRPADIAAIRRVLGPSHAGGTRPAKAESGVRTEGLSARNQLRGTIVGLKKAGLLCEVVLRLPDGQIITAIITESSANRLGLRKGREASAIIKATEVMIQR